MNELSKIDKANIELRKILKEYDKIDKSKKTSNDTSLEFTARNFVILHLNLIKNFTDNFIEPDTNKPYKVEKDTLHAELLILSIWSLYQLQCEQFLFDEIVIEIMKYFKMNENDAKNFREDTQFRFNEYNKIKEGENPSYLFLKISSNIFKSAITDLDVSIVIANFFTSIHQANVDLIKNFRNNYYHKTE
jgi:hypothetical protein